MSSGNLKEKIFELISKTSNGVSADDLWEHFRTDETALDVQMAINELQEEGKIIIHPKRFEAK